MKKPNKTEKFKEVFNLDKQIWQPIIKENVDAKLDIMLSNSIEGKYIWNVMGANLLYAADLVPEIAEDIVNIDNAMKWGFAWR